MHETSMADWSKTWKKIRQAPKRDLAYRFASKVRRSLSGGARPPTDAPAYAVDVVELKLRLHDWPLPPPLDPGFVTLADASVRGEFDLLGSGPVSAFRGESSAGFLGHRYLDVVPSADLNGDFLAIELPSGPTPEAKRLWKLIEKPHPGIDWGRDLRSGYRWPTSLHQTQIKVDAAPGADVKLPLELGRLQHLPWLALAFGATKDPAYSNTLQTHLLDYLAANPPGWGPTWLYAMDVAIRAANIVLAVELLCSAGSELDAEFEAIVARSLVEHGRFIVENLEWHPERRTNHYLANLAGLAWLAAAIPEHPEAPIWRAFAQWQLGVEIVRQFLSDGGNFEASTGYHRLSAEMAIWAIARLRACPDDRSLAPGAGVRLGRFVLPPTEEREVFDGVHRRLAAAIRFMEDVSAPDGIAVQIGDHDSGRYFKLDGHDRIERSLDFSGTIDAGKVLFGGSPTGPAGQVMAGCIGSATIPHPDLNRSVGPTPSLPNFPANEPGEHMMEMGDGIWEGLELIAYPHFGLYLYRSLRALLAVRCGPVGQSGYGGHAHNDALSLSLFADGAWIVRDPGSFVYTPSPEERDRYRSVRAHFAPHGKDREPNPLDAGMFRLPDRSKAQTIRFDDQCFCGYHDGYGVRVYRLITIRPNGIAIRDWTENEKLELVDRKAYTPIPFSPGYGIREGG